MTASTGTCFGFRVTSALPLRYLRPIHPGDPLVVELDEFETVEPESEPLIDWKPGPGRPFHGKLYERAGSYDLWIDTGGCFTIDPRAHRIGVPETADALRREERLWGIPALLCFLRRGDLPLHAAALETDRGALLLAAPAAFGKTTLAAAFLQAGYGLLSEDLACLRNRGEPCVVPGPTMMRVREDVADQLDLSFGERLGVGGGRVHLRVPAAGTGAPVPLRAVVLLQPDAPAPALERVPPTEALRELFALSFRLPTKLDNGRCFSALADLVGAVPVWRLSHPRRFDTLEETVARMMRVV